MKANKRFSIKDSYGNIYNVYSKSSAEAYMKIRKISNAKTLYLVATY